MTGLPRGACSEAQDGARVPPVGLTWHLPRVGVVMLLAGLLLWWLVAHTDVLFADGLRYIAQARAFGRGTLADALLKAVDHPAYPFAVASVHHLIRGESPESWQRAAQLASVFLAILLVIPVYLVARELFRDRVALPACLLIYAVPLTGHVFADALSESTFLLFWAWGLWGALRFLDRGRISWLLLTAAMAGLAYLTRPEGLLLPAALVVALAICHRWVVSGLGKRVLVGFGVLLVGLVVGVVPFAVMKGGLGTKPSIARLLGTAPRSDTFAVERQRPLDAHQSAAKTYALAGKSVLKAVTEAMTWPLAPLALVGLLSIRPRGAGARQWTLLAVIGVASFLALVRLHATGGYCSPRHTLIPVLILIPAAAAGLITLISGMIALLPRAGLTWTQRALSRAETIALTVTLLGLAATFAPQSLAPVNEGLQGYRDAGRWLAAQPDLGRDAHIVDVTGWSQFYSARPGGYTFENLQAAAADPSARWVVVREAHLLGPWYYCKQLGALVEGRIPTQVFVGNARRRSTRVFVFDRQSALAQGPARNPDAIRR